MHSLQLESAFLRRIMEKHKDQGVVQHGKFYRYRVYADKKKKKRKNKKKKKKEKGGAMPGPSDFSPTSRRWFVPYFGRYGDGAACRVPSPIAAGKTPTGFPLMRDCGRMPPQLLARLRTAPTSPYDGGAEFPCL
jgi:hypothetical protein